MVSSTGHDGPMGASGVKRLAKLGMITGAPGMGALDMNTAEDAVVRHQTLHSPVTLKIHSTLFESIRLLGTISNSKLLSDRISENSDFKKGDTTSYVFMGSRNAKYMQETKYYLVVWITGASHTRGGARHGHLRHGGG